MTEQHPTFEGPADEPDVAPVTEESEPEETPVREPEKPRKFDAPEDAEDTGRYAAYDRKLGRYVGGVHTTRSKAKDAGKDAGVAAGDLAVVEV